MSTKYSRRKRFKKYMAFISQKECECCGKMPVEVAHTGPAGMAQKADDRWCLPICSEHHRHGEFAYHQMGARAFFSWWGLSWRSLVLSLQGEYLLTASGKDTFEILDPGDDA